VEHEYAITTSELTRRFGSIIAVNGIDLRVPLRSVYGFLGPNGSGKTTTIRMLLGLIRPDSGEVSLFGERLRSNRIALLRRVGALVESPSLYPHLTGRENLEVIRRLVGGRRQQIEEALRIVQMEDAGDRRVLGYSTGMRQRLGLAAALMSEPELLILDEPTNGLDPAGIQQFRDLIRRMPEQYGLTVLLSSHLLAEVEQVATHIGIVNQGSLRFQATLESLHAHMEKAVIIQVDQPDETRRLLGQAGWEVRSDGMDGLAVRTSDRSDVARINALIVQKGINVFRLHMEQPTLEDVFLELTTE
jgi:lantibiotic transport system ATP-binding protein